MFQALRRGSALTRSERKEVGPVQIIVLGFENINLEDDILPELRRLRRRENVRLVDMVVVTKSGSGELVAVDAKDLTQKESTWVAGMARALAGLETGTSGPRGGPGVAGAVSDARSFLGDERTWSVAEAIPAGRLAVVVLLEHRWAIPVRDAVQHAGGATLADAWVHPDDLALFGANTAGQKHD